MSTVDFANDSLSPIDYEDVAVAYDVMTTALANAGSADEAIGIVEQLDAGQLLVVVRRRICDMQAAALGSDH